MSERTRNFIVGFTALLGLAGFAGLIIIFGEVPAWVTKSYIIHVDMDDAMGLGAGARIRFSGIDVGEISKIQIKPNPADGVEITCRIEEKYDLPRDVEVKAVTGLFGGTAALTIGTLPDARGKPTVAYLPRDGSARLRGRVSSMLSEFQAIAQRLETQLSSQVGGFGDVSKKLIELGDQYISVGKQIERILESRDPKDVDAGKTTGNLVTILARADSRMAELKTTIAAINAMIDDPKLQSDLKQTVASINSIVSDPQSQTDIKQTLTNTRKLTEQTSQQLDQLTRRAMGVADDLSKSLASLDGFISDARAGKGTLHKLFHDPAMYDSMTDAAGRLSDAIKDFKLLLQKWKSEGLPIQY